MPDIHIHREHALGFAQARKIAFSWAEQAEAKFDMECTYEEGDTEDTLYFTRSGVKGTLLVDARQFEMKAQLGFLFGAFKDRIEAEIGEQLDALLSPPKPAARKAAGAKAAAPVAAPAAVPAPAPAAGKKPSKPATTKPSPKAKKA
ncbi:polyhydroxyalkanoic acid system family protein [Paracidovorax sp. MALMAid1276]|uniref:polyhydroxyalkanoic acid system family protein n=1 Tax=Paracidovorax sp. MALMAid1276 TaxID=3411631 RepID=UPI003B9C4E54